ncbi:Dot/Icm T4SS effector AnkC/LegA12 [Legionella micdadei]|uniref:Uncharacterized protein n=1 Tax=Legionella micdadei TaxID=451 RepID=A0A098GCE0_LEGMI|nr:Dot/Icm T4SS effector AnkC/LegA12 [Legionella micdadei]ARG98192.1 hypothetical protein B6N58_11295 [Legionella micdadei]KTD29969.1 ankyrin repeat-containing protein [Legionella micdadei]NSL18973.1 ankyrin repeat domain-containing protein [Legionella micdadei]CEG60149.1 protein of unknown function [ankyrin repeat] [Legionella micdadei]SCY64546.1 hypothetical protein SAMN02982997_02358 [Legionella micdadei]
MKSFRELEKAIAAGEEAFNAFILKEIENDEQFLRRRFLVRKNKQLTVLNYLIYKHQKGLGNPHMQKHIKMLLDFGAPFNSDCSIHLLLRLQKFELFSLFMPSSEEVASEIIQKINFDNTDIEGRTLLSRAIDTKHPDVIRRLLKNNFPIDVNKPSRFDIETQFAEIQPLHQAVVNDFPHAIYYLLENGAILDSPCGELDETPILLSARLGKIKSLEVLLAATAGKNHLDLEATNNQFDRPIDLLCKRLEEKKNPQEALCGIAMLLCHGAKAPREEKFRDLLIKNRFALIDEVKKYKNKTGNSVAKFVRACHDKNNPLHDIMYANTWFHALWRYSCLQWIWHLFGLPCDEAFLIEKLVYDGPDSIEPIVATEFTPLDSIEITRTTQSRENSCLLYQSNECAEALSLEERTHFTQDERKFSEFVWRYSHTCGFFKAPWSTMYRKLTLGACTDIEEVREYSEKQVNATTTTRTIINAMDGRTPSVHDDLLGTRMHY